MVLWKREGSSRKGTFKILAQRWRSKPKKGQQNYKTGSHCEPKAKQSPPPRPEISDYTNYETITPIRVTSKIKRNLWNLFLESV
jgi:hypothetical protein